MTASTQRVNYDLIAHLYDEPGRDYETDPNLINFLSEREDRVSSQIRILDIGCGTGKQLTADRNQFPAAQMIGVDLFHGMLEQARKRCGSVEWIQGDSVNPPFANNSFDYITNQFSYHHVQDKNRMIASIFRILKPKGRFVITNLDPWCMPEWILYQCFPPARQRDLSDFLPVDELTDRMHKTGFCNISTMYRHANSEVDLNDFLDYASQRYRTSQLLVIPDDDYEAGLAKLRERAAEPGTDAHVFSEVCLVWILADKPR